MTDTSAAVTPTDVAGDGQNETADDARSVAGSEKSTSSVRSGIPKFSGIKPPSAPKPPTTTASKIGRPCGNQQTKPAVPATPTKSSSYDYERKEDTRRYKLTDVQETEEYEEDFFGNRLHTLPPRRNAYYANKNPYYDFCERLDFFGNPMISYPPKYPRFRYYYSPDREIFKEPDYFRKFLTGSFPRRASYSPPKFEDIFSEFFWTTPRRASYSTSSYKKDDTYKESESFGSSSLYNYSPRRRSSLGSTGTTSSMDALWELHPRRLSEAGLSRHSDSSAILTEDTDSFIIGQRVWVGGTKSGQIAYIGETQFAPGEWAGIVLDQPIGKNDGSVGGVRYFQCEPKKGVFSRLTRLTRYPLDIGGGDSFACTSPSPTNGNRKSPISPTASTRSALSISNTSLASTQVDFRVGDRVIIKSGQGSKIGTLRYMGFTSFANGEWCGVELDEPRGKNDGAVEGKRYFDCRPNFGLFAPVNKVSRSPSNRKPGGNCVVHPNAAMRRGGSKESLTSMTSSLASANTSAARRVRLGVTSLTPKKTPPKPTTTPLPSRTALQDVLKEKQQHIEQLLKERDLERAEITRAASQADEAEQKFATLRQEFEQYRNECDLKLKEYAAAIEKLKTECNEALVQLDDEKRKNEDLQFKFEEAAITKSDIEVTNEANVSRIQELQTELEQKQALCEVDSARLSQMQEELAHSREENESLKVSLEHASEKRISLEYDESKSIELVQSLQSQLEDANNTLKQRQEESHKQIEALSTQLTKQTSEFEVATFKYKTEIEEARAKYSIDVTAKTQEVEALKVELIETKEHLERVCKDLEKQKYDSVGVESNLKKEAERVKMELSSKIVETENFLDNISKKEAEIEGLTQENSKLKLDFANLQKQFESDVLSLKANEENLVRQLEELKAILNAKGGELELVRKAQEELEKQRALLSESQEGSNKKLTETQSELQKVNGELQSKIGELDIASSSIKKLEEAVNAKQDENNKITAKCKEVEDKLAHELNTMEETKSVIGKLELEAGDYQRKLQQNESKFAELTQQKQKLELDIQQLYGSSGEDSAKLEALNSSLREKEAEVANLKDECSQKVQNAEHLLQQMEIALQNSSQKAEREVTDLKQKLENLEKEHVETKNKAEGLIIDKDKCNEELLQQLNAVKMQIQEKEVALKKALEDLEIYAKNSSGEINKVTADYQSKIELLTKEICVQKESYTKATQELNEVRNTLVAQGEENVSKCSKLQEEYENSLKTVNGEIARRDEAIQKLQLQVAQFGEDSATKNSAVEEKILEIARLKGEFEKAVCAVEELQVERQKFAEEINKKQAETEAGYNGKIQEMQGEIESGRGKIQELLSQLELSKNDVNSNLVDMEGKEQQISQLVSDLQEARSSVENLAKEKTKLEDLSKQNEEVNKKQREELSKQIVGLQENMVKAEGAFKNIEAEKGFYQDVFKMLSLTDGQKSKLLKSLQGKELQGVVKDIKVEQDEAKLQLLDLQEITNKTNAALEGAKQQLQMQQTEILNLQNEIIKAKQEKTLIPEEVTAITDASITNNNKVSNDYKQLLEEKLFAESEVQFLNSIIVDMQKKNEEQKARIEILESGYSPAAADELKLMGFVEKKTPPRLYCDICEEFDLHETEDCPLQAAEDLPAPPREDNGKKEKAPPRPYCEICEMFGHSTEDCQDDQTF